MVAARTEEEVDGVVGGVVAVAEANINRSAADGRPAAAVVRAAIPHSLPFAVHEKRGRVSMCAFFTLERSTTNKTGPPQRKSIKHGADGGINRKFLPLFKSRRIGIGMEKRAR